MLTYMTAGESHGPQLTAILDGLPAGLTLDISRINYQLARRQKGYGRGGRMKIETDEVQITSGLRGSVCMGGPVTMIIANRDWENWSRLMHPTDPAIGDLTDREKHLVAQSTRPRPGHADLAGGIKWDHHDLRNVLERASARETAARVAVGGAARQLLDKFSIRIVSHVVRIGAAALPPEFPRPGPAEIESLSEASVARCLDASVSEAMVAQIKQAGHDSDSLGGIAEVIVDGLPVGLGSLSQSDRRLDGRIAGAMMAIPSVKGVQIGLGFEAAARRGSQVHDEIFADAERATPRKGFKRTTNNAGGLEGGITNGEPLVIQVAGKPLSTLNRPLRTVDVVTRTPETAMVERTDICVTPALAVVAEAVAALVLADAFLEKFGGDNVGEIERNYHAFLNHPY